MMQTTQTTQATLLAFTQQLLPLDPSLPDVTKVFLLCLHDWLAYLTHQPLQWPHYDTSLLSVVKQKTKDLTYPYHQWMSEIPTKSLTINSLLYRQYLVTYVVDQEIVTTPYLPSFYLLIGSMLTDPPIFYPLPIDNPWQGIDDYPHPIDGLRKHHSLIIDRYHQTIDQDLDDGDPTNDHGRLSSFSLIHGLYVAYTILLHEERVHALPYLSMINSSLHHALTHLQGVLIHAKD